jgi:hypothetical protein
LGERLSDDTGLVGVVSLEDEPMVAMVTGKNKDAYREEEYF